MSIDPYQEAATTLMNASVNAVEISLVIGLAWLIVPMLAKAFLTLIGR